MTLLTVTALMMAMLSASAMPAMAFNTFQFPILNQDTGEEVIGVEEKGSGPPAASEGPAAGSVVFHCEGGGATVAHTIPPTGEIGEKRTGGGDCEPENFKN